MAPHQFHRPVSGGYIHSGLPVTLAPARISVHQSIMETLPSIVNPPAGMTTIQINGLLRGCVKARFLWGWRRELFVYHFPLTIMVW
jgi:hypothetical protein